MATWTTKPNTSSQNTAADGTSTTKATITRVKADSGPVMARIHLRPTRSTSSAATTTPKSPTAAMLAVVTNALYSSNPAPMRIRGIHVRDK
ncbi:hypothetical protein D3C73_1528890 [compost metagenome]